MHELLPDIPGSIRNSCLTLGNFDGVHLGHRQMLLELAALAKVMQCPTVAVTFDPHPLELLRPSASPPLLTTIAQRTKLLLQAGVEHVFCIPVTHRLLEMTAQEFFDAILVERFAIRGIVEGPNFMFGRHRTGNVTVLRELCAAAEVECRIVDLVVSGGTEYSSSRIRRLLQDGDVSGARTLLGRPYEVSGVVEQGEGRGKTLGFPTANLGEIATLVPAHGVYAAVAIVDGTAFPAAINIGPNPTFQSLQPKVECHIVGFIGDLYHRQMTVRLLRKLRSVRRFDSVDELKRQIAADIALSASEFEELSLPPASAHSQFTGNDPN